jgi:hypothetical protein
MDKFEQEVLAMARNAEIAGFQKPCLRINREGRCLVIDANKWDSKGEYPLEGATWEEVFRAIKRRPGLRARECLVSHE